jgi:hypothetical protein
MCLGHMSAFFARSATSQVYLRLWKDCASAVNLPAAAKPAGLGHWQK